jgi:hypothetical protein
MRLEGTEVISIELEGRLDGDALATLAKNFRAG